MPHQASERARTTYDSRTLWARWIDLRNGDLAQAEEIIHAEFAVHRIPPRRSPINLAGGKLYSRGSGRPDPCSMTCA